MPINCLLVFELFMGRGAFHIAGHNFNPGVGGSPTKAKKGPSGSGVDGVDDRCNSG